MEQNQMAARRQVHSAVGVAILGLFLIGVGFALFLNADAPQNVLHETSQVRIPGHGSQVTYVASSSEMSNDLLLSLAVLAAGALTWLGGLAFALKLKQGLDRR